MKLDDKIFIRKNFCLVIGLFVSVFEKMRILMFKIKFLFVNMCVVKLVILKFFLLIFLY